MSQTQRIFNMLAKKPATKLSASRKVKFALTDDILELSKEAATLNREAFANYQEYQEIKETYERDLRAMEMLMEQKQMEAEVLLSEIQTIYNQAESSANDIGIPLPDQIENAYSDAVDYLQWVMDPR